MREIKFRGIDIQRKEWVYGYFYMFADTAYIIKPGRPGIPEQHIEVIPESVGQYIGLDDRNDVEIYEGDIVKYLEWHHSPDINQKSKMAMVEFNLGNFNLSPFYNLQHLVLNGLCEVISNIYENPGLLQQT